MKALAQSGVSRIVYISCNPKTLAQNLATAMLFGYKTSTLKAYDNFPFTRHTEAVALLRKEKEDDQS